MHFWAFPETTRRQEHAARRRSPSHLVLWDLYEWPSDDEHPPGDASHDDSILMFLGSGVF